jgi:hypothetical protein
MEKIRRTRRDVGCARDEQYVMCDNGHFYIVCAMSTATISEKMTRGEALVGTRASVQRKFPDIYKYIKKHR